jgi:hypothetical protein
MTGRGGSGSGDAERRLRVRMTERPARPGAGSSSSTLPPPRANSVPGRGEQPLGRSAAAQLSCRGLLPYVPVCAPSRTRTCCLLLRKSFRLRSRPADSGGEQDSRYPPVTVVAPVAGLFWHASGTGMASPSMRIRGRTIAKDSAAAREGGGGRERSARVVGGCCTLLLHGYRGDGFITRALRHRHDLEV